MQSLWSEYGGPHLERPLLVFMMLRGLLARPIERLLLLDRLLFVSDGCLGVDAHRQEANPSIVRTVHTPPLPPLF